MSRKKKKSKKVSTLLPDLSRRNEPFSFESSETQLEEILMTGSLEKVHAQLRRLRNDCSILQDAAITAVPNHKSKVFFDYVNVPKFSNGGGANGGLVQVGGGCEVGSGEDGTVLGYNMCECGFEGISLKVAKRSCNQDSGSAEVSHKDGGGGGAGNAVAADDTVSIHVENETPTRGTEAAEKVGCWKIIL